MNHNYIVKASMKIPRAYVRQRSGRHLDLLNPSPTAWTDEDLAIGLSRTFRWGGHSVWPLPLSVAQHSMMVLAIAMTIAGKALTLHDAIRELVHDADEALIGGFDPISPLKPFLGHEYSALANRLQKAVFSRYHLTEWTHEEYQWHKQADILAAASEAVHVAGWEPHEVKDVLEIRWTPLSDDPLAKIFNCEPWKPWAPDIAAERFLAELQGQGRVIASLVDPKVNSGLCELDCHACHQDPDTCLSWTYLSTLLSK